MKSRIALLAPWFGELPEYFELFAKSVSNNPILSYHFWTDRPISETKKFEKYQNLFFHHISFTDYCKEISTSLGIDIDYKSPYKLCDVRQFMPYIHIKSSVLNIGYLSDYQFIGFADIDLIFGDMQSYLLKVIDKIDYFSTHPDRISGHFFFMRNEEKFLNRCFEIKNWKTILSDPQHYGIDEGAYCDVVCPILGIVRRIWHRTSSGLEFGKSWKRLNKLCGLSRFFISNRKHFKELHSTHSAIAPDILKYEYTDTEWVFKGGKIYGQNNGKEYCYLHFLFLKNTSYLPVKPTWDSKFFKVNNYDSPILISRTEIANIDNHESKKDSIY